MRKVKRGGLALLFSTLTLAGTAGQFILNYNSTESEPNDTRLAAGSMFQTAGSSPSFKNSVDRDYYLVQVVTLPTTLTANVQGVPGNDPAVQLENASGGVLASNLDIQPGVNLNAALTYRFSVTTGTFYIVVYCQNYNVAATGYTLSGQFIQQDNTPPYYTGAVGIQSVTRDGYGAAEIAFAAASDNLTLPQFIIYNIYWSNSVVDLFTPPPDATVTGGVLLTTVSGLDPRGSYYFAVRARDLASNEEQNDVYLFGPILMAVRPNHWPLYE